MKHAFTAERIFTGTEWLEGKAVIVENGTITALLPTENLPVPARDFGKHWMVPAFMDIQIYGANRKLFALHPTVEALQDLATHCRAGGTSHFQVTLATNTREVFFAGIDAVREYWKSGGEGLLGLHLEGPWINSIKRGAHIENLIHSPEIEEVREVLEYGKGVVTMITLAPETCSDAVIDLIRSYDVIISAGHSNCTYEEAIRSFDRGIHTVTHLYNAMSPLQHREPGLVGACFQHPSVRASIIADGHHVNFEAIAIAKKLMGQRLFVITDAVTEALTGPYQHRLEGNKYTCNGTLSGSAVSMLDSVKNLVRKVGIELEEALRMCSLYPAQVMRVDESHGRIAPGARAQFVVLTRQLELVEMITC